jgi:hypothetical protein
LAAIHEPIRILFTDAVEKNHCVRKVTMPVKGYAAIVYVFEAILRLFLV